MDMIKGDLLNPSNTFQWSQEFRDMLGFTDETDFPNIFSSWINRLHPEDLDETLIKVSAHVL